MNAPVNIWAWWQKALANPSAIGTDLPVHENDPQPGYFRMRQGKDSKEFIPVAIYPGDDGVLRANVGPWSGGEQRRPEDVWTWCCRNPVHFKANPSVPASKVNFHEVAVEGKPWADSIKALITVKAGDQPAEGAEVAPGHNSGADQSELDKLKDAIEEVAGRAKADRTKLGKVSLQTWTDADKDRIANASGALFALAKKVDERRKELKRPHQEKVDEIDGAFMPVFRQADAAAKDLKQTVGEWLRLLDAENAEKRRLEQERLRKEREALPQVAQELIPAAPAVDEAKTRVRAGNAGKSITLVDRPVATIVDPVAFATYLLDPEQQNGPNVDVMEVLRRIANRLAPHITGGIIQSVPGVSAKIEKVAR